MKPIKIILFFVGIHDEHEPTDTDHAPGVTDLLRQRDGPEYTACVMIRTASKNMVLCVENIFGASPVSL